MKKRAWEVGGGGEERARPTSNKDDPAFKSDDPSV